MNKKALCGMQQASSLSEGIRIQRELLQQWLSKPLEQLARACAKTPMNAHLLEQLLINARAQMVTCKHLYVLDHQFRQITSNVHRDSIDSSYIGRDCRGRPYTVNILGKTEFKLSQAYISRRRKRPSITATRVIRDDHGQLLGFLCADFDLRELPHTEQCYREPDDWHQLKGDPAIRRGLFAQQRVESIMDDNIDDALETMHELITEYGVYHGEIHFSRSRATVWHRDDPYSYHILSINELTSPDSLLAYPKREYFNRAQIPVEDIKPVFDMFRQLRFADDNIYLRSGSINIVNAIVGLNFSCDGSHYMRYTEFLEKDIDFWFGRLDSSVGSVDTLHV